ncbi:MAG: AAA family ATPase, partial [Actinomycetota bacterium]|nr:AAA family ATPase [Actinomycetota bacterium]
MVNPEITICGRLAVTWDGRSLESELPGRQGRLIFAYLVLNRARPVRRDALVEALWEGVPNGGDALLAPPLSRLRKALGAGKLKGRTELTLVLEEDVRIDWEEAQESLAEAQRLLASGGDAQAAWQSALNAETILGGGLLPGLEARWIDEHRVVAEEMRLKALEAVARSGARLGPSEQARAERAARGAVEASPFRESARAAQIEVMQAQGNVAEALRSYEELRVLLREELGTFPSSELTALHEQLLNAHETPARPVATGNNGRSSSEPVLPGELIDPRMKETELVGRSEIMEQLEDELEKASVGELRIALLSGEGGVGKTRLAAELAAGQSDVAVLYGRCEPDEIRPFRIWSGLLRTALGQLADTDINQIVGPDGPTLSRLLPELSKKLDLPPPGPPADLEFERQALFGAVMRMIGRLSLIKPILIVLDDLHWADRSTLLLLSSLAGDNPPRGVLALGIYRDTDLAPDSFLLETLVNLQRRRPTLRLKVGALESSEVGRLIEGRVNESLAPVLHDQTGGNPFYIEQMVRHIEETGGDDPEAVPAELRQIIIQRAASLPDGGAELLGRAALIGLDFELEILLNTTAENEDRVIELLDAAVQAGLLDESAAVPGRYSFVHALLRSTLDEEMSLTRRAQVHRNIGEAIEKQTCQGEERRLGELAWHFGQAGP